MTRRKLTEEERLGARLAAIRERMSTIADLEAAAAPVGGIAARGIFEDEKDRLIAETDQILDRLTQLGASLPFQFK